MQKNIEYKKEDFTYSANAEGYMIKYKGQNIGGARILGKFKGRGRSVAIQRNDYARNAENEIENIVNGYIHSHYQSAIEKINQSAL